MKQPDWVKESRVRGNAYTYSKQNPCFHNSLNLALFLLIVAGSWEIFRLGHAITPGLYIPMASIFLGFLFFCLFILVVHEASHFMFLMHSHPKWHRFWNRLFGWLVCIPFGVNFKEHWEKGHLTHHHHPMEPPDPQICNPRTGKDLLKQLLKFLIPGYIQTMGIYKGGGTEFDCEPVKNYPKSIWRIFLVVAFWTALFTLIYYISGKKGVWPQFFAAFFGVQVLAILTHIKTALEHGGVMRSRKNEFFRQYTSRFPLRYILLPFNISYHFEHHLNYTVPWYLLPKYYSQVRKQVPEQLLSSVYNKHPLQQLKGQPPDPGKKITTLASEGI